jgi:putative tryptophan/tyrosine transport system substrate-binding protein
MNRREFIAALGGTVAWPFAARAQQSAMPVTGRPARVGILTGGGQPANPAFEAFRREMLRLGYVEGRTLIIEFRSAAGANDRLPDLAAELVRLPVDIILTEATPATIAAKQATSTIPIVMGVVADALGPGLVDNLARPGGNITGFTTLGTELESKRLGLLKEAFPAIKRLGVLADGSNNPAAPIQLASTMDAARALDLLVEVDAKAETRADIPGALDRLKDSGVSALDVLSNSVFFNEHKLIVLLVTAKRLPAIYADAVFPEAGGLMSYGPDVRDNFRRAAGYVDRILKGAKAGELPVEQPTKFELIINLGAAKAIGVTLPSALVLRADKVIE